jgi:hypothetical protein
VRRAWPAALVFYPAFLELTPKLKLQKLLLNFCIFYLPRHFGTLVYFA